MTPRQIALARQALGLNESCLVSRRNVFLTSRGTGDWIPWRHMAMAGWAERVDDPAVPLGMTLFKLTRAGAEAVLLPGERLDPQDWP